MPIQEPQSMVSSNSNLTLVASEPKDSSTPMPTDIPTLTLDTWWVEAIQSSVLLNFWPGPNVKWDQDPSPLVTLNAASIQDFEISYFI